MEHFKKLGLNDAMMQAIQDHNFEKPSEVQEKSIPPILEGRDVIAGSATGSGKTLAFAAGIIHHCQPNKGIQALVLTPTRELAEQVMKTIKKFSKYKPLKIAVVYGGVSIQPQIRELRYADVVIGTPGRLLDHLERRTLSLSRISILVLDEADRMLDMGFLPDVEQIIKLCPRERQTMFFSATISKEIAILAKKYMKEIVMISAEKNVDPAKLKQVYYDVQDQMKFSLLVHLLKHEHPGLVMVFCNSRKNADFVARNLTAEGIHASAIHGGFSQNKRNAVLEQFHNKKAMVLVCTDVAARGLDIKGVSHVYNYDIPRDSKEYIHRIGRTARAGNEGKAVNILSSRDHDNFSRVLQEHRSQIKKELLPLFPRIQIQWREPSRSFQRPSFSGGYGRSYGGGRSGHGGRSFYGRPQSGGSFNRRSFSSGHGFRR